mgnify:CR=1 FL=1
MGGGGGEHCRYSSMGGVRIAGMLRRSVAAGARGGGSGAQAGDDGVRACAWGPGWGQARA